MAKVSRVYPQRVKFPEGKQGEFIVNALSCLGFSERDLGAFVGVHRRTVNSWKREEGLMSLPALEVICKELEIGIPSYAETKDPFWYVNLGSKKGWETNVRRYGGFPAKEENRKRKWMEWREKNGVYGNDIFQRRVITRPSFSKDLAEFVGIVMGDGGITKKTIIITLNSEDDKLYAVFVEKLLKNLFCVPVVRKIRPESKAVKLIVSRTELVDFCHNKLGLKIGHKLDQGLDVPSWIYVNLDYQRRCIRGLVDTDGCIFYERHKIKGKVYSYPRLNFTSCSPSLIKSFFTMLQQMGFSPCIRRRGKAVQLEKKEEIRQYLNTIGTSNPKHKERFLAE